MFVIPLLLFLTNKLNGESEDKYNITIGSDTVEMNLLSVFTPV